MSPLWLVFQFELRRNLKRRSWLLATLAVPLLALLVLEGAQLSGGGGTVPGVNLPGLSATTLFSSGDGARGLVDESGLFGGGHDLLQYADPAAAEAALARGEIGSWYHVQADYLETGVVQQVMPALDVAEVSRGAIRRHILASLADEVDARLLERLERPMRLRLAGAPESAAALAAPGDQSATLAVYPFTIALMFSLFMTSGYLLQGVIEEKETRVIEILLSSLQPALLFGGKVLAFGALGLLQLLFWLAGILLVLRRLPLTGTLSALAQFVLPPDALPLMIVYFVLAYLMFAAAFGILGALSASMREGPQYAVIFTLPAVAPLWVSAALTQDPHGGLAVALSLFPLTAPLAMLQRALVATVPAWQLAASVALMLLGVAVLMWLAGRVFRVQTLLAGRMPRLRELPRLLRA